MPSLIVTANTTAQEVAAERRDSMVRPTSINIDNSPSETNGVPAPLLTTVDRWRYNVLLGDSITLDEPSKLLFLAVVFVAEDQALSPFYFSPIHPCSNTVLQV